MIKVGDMMQHMIKHTSLEPTFADTEWYNVLGN